MIHKELSMKIYKDLSELSNEDQKLLKKAIEQLDYAYAPYSEFYVGSALRLKSSKIYVGSNQENASYPLCMCGERVALYNAIANEPKGIIEAIVITAKNPKKKLEVPVAPCGACRQVMVEFENRQKLPYRILLKVDGAEVYEFKSAKDLLPFSFDGSFL